MPALESNLRNSEESNRQLIQVEFYKLRDKLEGLDKRDKKFGYTKFGILNDHEQDLVNRLNDLRVLKFREDNNGSLYIKLRSDAFIRSANFIRKILSFFDSSYHRI